MGNAPLFGYPQTPTAFGSALDVNDGKRPSRLRNGGRITTDTLDRIRAFMARNSDGAPARRRVLFEPTPPGILPVVKPAAPPVASGMSGEDPQRNFRFFDNRQKYLLFVNTCSEKWEVASRVGLEIANIHPRPPAVRWQARLTAHRVTERRPVAARPPPAPRRSHRRQASSQRRSPRAPRPHRRW